MADGLPAFDIPPGAVPVAVGISGTVAGGSQTIAVGAGVPTGKRQILLSAYVTSANAGATPGTLEIQVVPEFAAAAAGIVGISVAANSSAAQGVSIVIPVSGVSGTINLVVTGMTAASQYTAGYTGYQEALEK